MNEETRQMILTASRPVRIAAAAALGMLALFLLIKSFDALSLFGQGQNPLINTITVSGTGTSSAKPDIAKITFTVQEQAKDVKTAQDAAAKKANDAIASLSAFGIADKDVKTADYAVSPQYEQAQPCYPGVVCTRVMTSTNTIMGYQVSETVTITLRDTAKAGDVVSKLGALGVQNISGPNFMVDDDSGVTNEARAEAIANARAKAKELAKELGVSLGEVVSYSDQGNQPYPMYAKDSMMSAGAMETPNLPTGSDERSVTVQVTYRIK